MRNYITVDGGTTNTRISLVSNNTVIDTLKLSVGARAGIGESDALRLALKSGIAELLSRNGKCEDDILKILASGMITSELGLVALPHLVTPAGIRELHATMHEELFSDVSKIPFVFVRGVKTRGDRLDSVDMMRGEETELVGIFSGEGVYILPGSHSKIIQVDAQGRITDFKTMLTGEMIYAIAESTILKSAVDLAIDEIDEKKLHFGYEYAKSHGINEALFKTRVLKNLFGGGEVETYSFYIGAMISGEIDYVLSLSAKRIVIGGRRQIKRATALLLKRYSDAEIVSLPDEETEAKTAEGIVKIYELADL